MRQRKRNKIIIIALTLIICMMGVGYAAFQTKLNIKGTSIKINIPVTSNGYILAKINDGIDEYSSTYTVVV